MCPSCFTDSGEVIEANKALIEANPQMSLLYAPDIMWNTRYFNTTESEWMSKIVPSEFRLDKKIQQVSPRWKKNPTKSCFLKVKQSRNGILNGEIYKFIIQILWNLTLFLHSKQQSHQVTILHMSRQLSYRDMCKGVT